MWTRSTLLLRSTAGLAKKTSCPTLLPSQQPRCTTGASFFFSSNTNTGPGGPAAVLQDSYEHITVERRGGVGLVALHRPQALNALCDALFADLIHAATALDRDPDIGCLVLTGSAKAFAAGADIGEMKDRTFDYAYQKVRVGGGGGGVRFGESSALLRSCSRFFFAALYDL